MLTVTIPYRLVHMLALRAPGRRGTGRARCRSNCQASRPGEPLGQRRSPQAGSITRPMSSLRAVEWPFSLVILRRNCETYLTRLREASGVSWMMRYSRRTRFGLAGSRCFLAGR